MLVGGLQHHHRKPQLGAVLRHLINHSIALPCRASGGLNKGQLEWHHPNRCTLGKAAFSYCGPGIKSSR